jgi:RHS repeat-associated protein
MAPMAFPPPLFMDTITISYNPSSTSTTWDGSTLTIGVAGTAGDFDQKDGDDNPMWTRLERNWFEDAKQAPLFTPSHVTAARLRHTPSGDPMLAGALSFSNSITIEHNTLGTGVVGHMLHSRAISPVTLAATDRWFAYDQVGSVIAETDADGELSATHHADAWGNRLEAWDTGIWGGQRSGWAHNTKEIDGLTDLTYMDQRWYAPETGTFLSRAPYPPMLEHEYGFAAGNPVMHTDSTGMIIDTSDPTLTDDFEEGCKVYLDAFGFLISIEDPAIRGDLRATSPHLA